MALPAKAQLIGQVPVLFCDLNEQQQASIVAVIARHMDEGTCQGYMLLEDGLKKASLEEYAVTAVTGNEVTTFHVRIGRRELTTNMPYRARPDLLAVAAQHNAAIVGIAIQASADGEPKYEPLTCTNPHVAPGEHVYIKAKQPGGNWLIQAFFP